MEHRPGPAWHRAAGWGTARTCSEPIHVRNAGGDSLAVRTGVHDPAAREYDAGSPGRLRLYGRQRGYGAPRVTNTVLFRNVSILDAERGTLIPDQAVLIEGERIAEVEPSASVKDGAARVIDVRGRVLMPGLIDAHVHVIAASADL